MERGGRLKTCLSLLLIASLEGGGALAAEAPKSASAAAPAASPAASNDASVIDFEADVIEGERLRPEIFVQMGSKEQEMSPVLYLRKHFNDFHFSDRKWRPGYFERGFVPKPAAKGSRQK